MKQKLSIVADALSRRSKQAHHKCTDIVRKLLSIAKVMIIDEGINKLEAEYKSDECFKEKWDNIEEPYVERGKTTYFENTLCIIQEKQENYIER